MLRKSRMSVAGELDIVFSRGVGSVGCVEMVVLSRREAVVLLIYHHKVDFWKIVF